MTTIIPSTIFSTKRDQKEKENLIQNENNEKGENNSSLDPIDPKPIKKNSSFHNNSFSKFDKFENEEEEKPSEEIKNPIEKPEKLEKTEKTNGDIPKSYCFFKISEKVDKPLELSLANTLTVLEIKQHLFQSELDNNKNVRIIYQGRQLKDEDKFSLYKLAANSFLHVFIQEKVEHNNTVLTAGPSMNTDYYNTVRGFARFRDLGLNDSELVFQRFDFHSHYVLIEQGTEIDLHNLVNREEEWMTLNLEKINNDPNSIVVL